MEAFAEIAPYLSHRLVLAGFALFVLIGLFRALLVSPKLAQLTRGDSGRVLLRAVNYGFFAAILVIVLGFALAFLREAEADPLLRWGALGGALLVCAFVGRMVLHPEPETID